MADVQYLFIANIIAKFMSFAKGHISKFVDYIHFYTLPFNKNFNFVEFGEIFRIISSNQLLLQAHLLAKVTMLKFRVNTSTINFLANIKD